MGNALVDHAQTVDRDQNTPAPSACALGYSSEEFRHLQQQAAFLRDATEDLLRRAGIGLGMHVLDIGCGAGDVSLIAGKLVGPSGRVLGVDRSREAIDIAKRRAAAAGRGAWTRFAAAELDTFSPQVTFDALIGRLILMYLPDPAAALRRLSRHLRPGGLVVFQEMVTPLMSSIPDGPEFSRSTSLIVSVLKRAGFEVDERNASIMLPPFVGAWTRTPA